MSENHKCQHKGCTSTETEQYDFGNLGRPWLCDEHYKTISVKAAILGCSGRLLTHNSRTW